MVVVASVVEEQPVGAMPDGYFLEGKLYELTVEKAFRGNPGPTIELFDENTSGRFDMSVGTKYLLFVYEEHGRFRVDNCGHSAEFSKSGATVKQVEKLAHAVRPQ
jgi:hypothetical protein